MAAAVSTSRLKPEPIVFSCLLPAPAPDAALSVLWRYYLQRLRQGLRCLDDAARARDCFEICDDRPGSRPLFTRTLRRAAENLKTEYAVNGSDRPTSSSGGSGCSCCPSPV